LADLIGADVVECHAPTANEGNRVRGAALVLSQGPWGAKVWLDVLAPKEDVDVLAEYAGPFAAGSPAVISRRRGRGTVFYVGTWPEGEFLAELMSVVCGEAAVEPAMATPEGVEALVRRGAQADYLFLTNHNNTPCEVKVERSVSRALLGDVDGGRAMLEPFGVAVVELEG